jgi:hypothetical protein
MTAERVLNHVLPALAGIKPNVTLKERHLYRFFYLVADPGPGQRSIGGGIQPIRVPFGVLGNLSPDGFQRGLRSPAPGLRGPA